MGTGLDQIYPRDHRKLADEILERGGVTAWAHRLASASKYYRRADVKPEDLWTAELYPDDFPARLDSVLEVIYLLFNEGYAAHSGDELIRFDVCREALRLGRLIADAPANAKVAALSGWNKAR